VALRGERRRQVWVSLSISRYLDLKFHLQQQKPDMAAANSFTLLRCVDMLPFASVCISFRGAQCSMCSASIERTLHPFFRKSSYSAATPGQYWICPEGHHRLQYQLFPGILASFDMFFFPKKICCSNLESLEPILQNQCIRYRGIPWKASSKSSKSSPEKLHGIGQVSGSKVGHAEQNGKPVCHRWDELAVLSHNMSTHKEALFTH